MKDKIVTITLSIILFIVPVLIIPNEWGPYNILKIIALLICGAILLILTLIRGKNLKFDKLDILIFIFGILAILSTIFSVNPLKSIIGEYNRYEGLLSIITYILVYYNAKYYFKNYKYFLTIGTVVYILICIFSIIQFYTGYKINLLPILGKGANGTFGNVNFMGSFVSIALPLFILGYIFKKKNIYLIASMLAFCSMVMCLTRSSWGAFVIYMILIMIYLFIKKKKIYFKRFAILIIGFVICFTIINAFDKANIISDRIEKASEEAQDILEEGIKNKNGSGRIEIWKICSQIMYKAPVLGCGIDALQDGLQHFCKLENLIYIYHHHVFIDKAHNEYLHIAVTMGLPAVTVYLSFIGGIVLFNTKRILKNKVIATYIIVIISYLAQAFFNISTIGVAPIFWFILGLASRNIKVK